MAAPRPTYPPRLSRWRSPFAGAGETTDRNRWLDSREVRGGTVVFEGPDGVRTAMVGIRCLVSGGSIRSWQPLYRRHGHWIDRNALTRSLGDVLRTHFRSV